MKKIHEIMLKTIFSGILKWDLLILETVPSRQLHVQS